jgi:hypothetical protein
LRSGWIVFSAFDENIYGIPQNGGKPRNLVTVPTDSCPGSTNTLAVSPDEQQVAFALEVDDEKHRVECNGMWVGDLKTHKLTRIATSGLLPLNPYWMDDETILYSGIDTAGGRWVPTGLYSLSLALKRIDRILTGPYLTPSVCLSDQNLYFSWGSKLQEVPPTADDWPTFNDFHGFHVWKISLREILHRSTSLQSGDTTDGISLLEEQRQ